MLNWWKKAQSVHKGRLVLADRSNNKHSNKKPSSVLCHVCFNVLFSVSVTQPFPPRELFVGFPVSLQNSNGKLPLPLFHRRFAVVVYDDDDKDIELGKSLVR